MMSGGDAKCLCAGWAASSAGPMQVTASGPGFSASGRNRRFPWNFWRFQPPHRRRVARAVDVHAGTGDQRGQPRFRAFGGRAGAGTPLIRQAQRPRTRKIANSVVSAFMGSGSDGGWLSGSPPPKQNRHNLGKRPATGGHLSAFKSTKDNRLPRQRQRGARCGEARPLNVSHDPSSLIIFRAAAAGDAEPPASPVGEDYCRVREQAERTAAERATSTAARRVHQELAQAYARATRQRGSQ